MLVLCQIRFNDVPALGERSALEAIRDRLGPDYPDIERRDEHEVQLHVGSPGLEVHQKASASHVLRSPHHPWWILVASAVATLATPVYSNRDEFIGRSAALRRAIAAEGPVPAIQRVGVRYVARVAEQDFLGDLASYVAGHMVGGAQLPLSEGAELAQSLLDVVTTWDDNVARVRTGLVGPGVVPDPAIEPLEAKSWLLDIDAYNEKYRPADEAVEETARGLAENQYQLFRGIVTERFLVRFGGRV